MVVLGARSQLRKTKLTNPGENQQRQKKKSTTLQGKLPNVGWGVSSRHPVVTVLESLP